LTTYCISNTIGRSNYFFLKTTRLLFIILLIMIYLITILCKTTNDIFNSMFNQSKLKIIIISLPMYSRLVDAMHTLFSGELCITTATIEYILYNYYLYIYHIFFPLNNVKSVLSMTPETHILHIILLWTLLWFTRAVDDKIDYCYVRNELSEVAEYDHNIPTV